MRRLFLSLLVFALTLPALAQAKHPFTFEDMMKLKRVGEPEVSPDGKWVIFSVVDVDLEANTKTPHVWIVPLSGTAGSSSAPGGVGMTSEREIIADQDGDRPRWAPDGKRFAFLSTKEGGSQVWIADFDGAKGVVTAVHRLTEFATEAGGELWSPDGKNILFTSDAYPECDGAPGAEAICNAKKVKETEQSKVKALVFDRLLYRHWNAYKAGKRSHIFVTEVCGGTAEGGCPHMVYRDLTPGDYDAPEFSLGGQDDYAFSPDGQEICYTSNHDKVEATSTNNDLWTIPVNTGGMISGNRLIPLPPQAKNITADNPASDSTPLYSPDGRYIAYRAQQRPGYESDRFRLMLYDRKTGEKKNLTEDFDRWVGSYAWLPNSKAIYFSSEQEGHVQLFRVGFDFGVTSIFDGTFDDPAFTPDGRNLLLTQMGIEFPNRIIRLDVSKTEEFMAESRAKLDKGGVINQGMVGEEPSIAADLNREALSHIAMSPLESFWFTGAQNDRVQGFLLKPPNFDASKKYPVKFLVHGGPQGAWGDDWSYRWNPELFAANGYVVVMINFHGSTGYGQKFIDAINGDWGGAPYEDLMKGLDYAEAHYSFIDKDRECALGASYGGYMANWILGHTGRFKCIVSHDGLFNAESAWGTTEELWYPDWEFKGTPYDNRELYRKWSPHQYATNFKTPTLVIHGQRDYRFDVSEGFQLFTTLQMEGVSSKMLYFPDEGHWVLKPQNSQLWYKTVNDWVDQWTKK